MKLVLKFILFFFAFSFYAQSEEASQEKYTYKLEKLILENKKDSTAYYLEKIVPSDYKSILEKILNRTEISYADSYQFFSSVANRNTISYEQVSKFIDDFIKEPKDKTINEDYFKIKWDQVYKLRDEVSIDLASEKQKELENYVLRFKDSDIKVQKAKLKLRTHSLVLFQIEQDVENGKKIALESLKKARELKDKELQIIFLYHLSDFLLLERKLQEYIDVSEESLKLEAELPEKTPYYYATTQHLIDAYIYKGGNNERVNFLIEELYNNSLTRIQTYSLYLKLISFSEPSSNVKNEILNKFEVSDVNELMEKFKILGKDLNPNDFFHILNEGSRALEVNKFYTEALDYKEKAIVLTRKIYSEDLSTSLANYKTDQAVKLKEKEIVHEKEQTKLYGVIALLAIILFIISLLVILKVKKQSKELSEKNKLVEQTLKEKELLVKEVHHRVKNNFQIVSSLLELQSRGIEDEKALELANEGKNRVKSMALIHQKLYQNESGLVDFDEYIKLLIKELSSLYASENKINTSISSEGMMFDVDTAIPLGLIINEIITNSYKYAFRNNKENNLSISINKEKSNDYKLTIEDNGPGLSDNFDVKKAKSLGLRLINRLVKQLHGSLKQTNKEGAKFEILFKDNNARQLVN
ncbi:sensor histidine kinase [Polaribacter pectinis]|uniref:histidine kinase n=1 Tax=Polaribacter pectinis TaxID=2738844 RepID=A0A7G9L9Y1_9FLAO|nr:sensor histidine kinase [Polaribacter pectinis]QNM85430.1 sensor histidine kinase [Polaribacter pectinis]